MKPITKPTAFKPCYIAQVREEFGLTAPNPKRKVKAPDRLKEYIREAIKTLQQEQIPLTYKNIQQKAFEIYIQKNKKEGIDRFFGILKPDREIIQDEELFYVD